MAIININTAGLPESDACPRGQYKVRIDEVGDPTQDKNNNTYVSLAMTIVGPTEYVNRKVFDNYVRLDSAKFRKVVASMGHPGETVKDTDDMIGWEGDVMLGIEESERFGERNTVSLYIVPQGAFASK